MDIYGRTVVCDKTWLTSVIGPTRST